MKKALAFPSLVGAYGPGSTLCPHGLLGHRRVLKVRRLVNTQNGPSSSVKSLPGTCDSRDVEIGSL